MDVDDVLKKSNETRNKAFEYKWWCSRSMDLLADGPHVWVKGVEITLPEESRQLVSLITELHVNRKIKALAAELGITEGTCTS